MSLKLYAKNALKMVIRNPETRRRIRSLVSPAPASNLAATGRQPGEFVDNLGASSNQGSDRNELAALAPYVKRMAETGEGTDACLELGCLPMLVHYYSPVPDIPDLINRGLFEKRTPMAGIDFRPEQQLRLLRELGQAYGHECNWPLKPTMDPFQFFLENGCFCFGCAAALHTMIRRFKPGRIIEVGSGMSSRVISGAIKRGVEENKDFACRYTVIDPYPGEVVRSGKLFGHPELIQEKVELTDLSLFEQLKENDILFVDSGHTVRMGSDINFIILDVLPRLQPGVIIHFHDINLPFPPPQVYYTNPAFRVFWTEEFLLQAFLCLNDKFEVLLAMNYLQTDHMDTFSEVFSHFDRATNWATSGSFWIRRTS